MNNMFCYTFSLRKRPGVYDSEGHFSGIHGPNSLEHSCPRNFYWSSDSPWNSASFGTKAREKKVWQRSILELEKAKKQGNLQQNSWKDVFYWWFFFFNLRESSEMNTIFELSAKSWVDSTNFQEKSFSSL